MEGGPLAQRSAHDPAGVASRALRVACEQPCLDFGSQPGQPQEVTPIDARLRSARTSLHLFRIPSLEPLSAANAACRSWMPGPGPARARSRCLDRLLSTAQKRADSRDAVGVPRILTACLSDSITIVVDAHDLPGLARFWTQALGWKVLSEREIVIGTDENAPVGMCLMPVTDPKTVKNRVHLDLTSSATTANGRSSDSSR